MLEWYIQPSTLPLQFGILSVWFLCEISDRASRQLSYPTGLWTNPGKGFSG